MGDFEIGSRDYDPSVVVVVDSPLTLKISKAGQETAQGEVRLDRFFRKCSAQPYDAKACYAMVMSYVPSLLSIGTAFDENRQSVVALVRAKDYVDEAKKDSPDIVASHYVGPLWVIYAVDTPRNTLLLTYGELKKLKISEQELDALAKDNLRRILGPMDERYKKKLPFNALQMMKGRNVYESSRLLLPEQWEGLANMQDYPLLVSVPARDLIIYTTASNPMAESVLKDMDYRAAKLADFPISPVVLEWTSAGWVERTNGAGAN